MSVIPPFNLNADSIMQAESAGLYCKNLNKKKSNKMIVFYGDRDDAKAMFRISSDKGTTYGTAQDLDTTYATVRTTAISPVSGNILAKTDRYVLLAWDSVTKTWSASAQYDSAQDITSNLFPKLHCDVLGSFWELQKAGGSVRVKKSINDGQSWSVSIDFTTTDSAEVGFDMAVWNGFPVIMYSRNSGQIYMRYAINDGWSNEIKTPYTHYYAANYGVMSVVVGDNGYIHMLYKTKEGSVDRYYHAIYNGASWISRLLVNDASATNFVPYFLQADQNDCWVVYRKTSGSYTELFCKKVASPYIAYQTAVQITSTAASNKINVHGMTIDDSIVSVLYETQTSPRAVYSAGNNINTAPYAPSILSPKDGDGVATVTPIMSWEFNDRNKEDYQTAYFITVQDVNTSEEMLATGWINSTASNLVYNGDALVFNNLYRWKAQLRDSESADGAESGWEHFIPIEPPVPIVLAPSGVDALETVSPVIEWDPDTSPWLQDAYQVVLWDDTGENIIFNSEKIIGVATKYQIPIGFISNNSDYFVEVIITNDKKVRGTSGLVPFSVAYYPAPNPSLSAYSDSDTGSINLEITSAKTFDSKEYAESDYINIYRKESEEDEDQYEIIQRLDIDRKVIDDFEDMDNMTSVNGTLSLDNLLYKEGIYSVRNTFVAQTQVGILLQSGSTLDLSDKTDISLDVFLSNVTNLTSIAVRIGNDSSNYFEKTITTGLPDAGEWRQLDTTKASMTTVGSPSWDSVGEYWRVVANFSSGASGYMSVDYLVADNLIQDFKDYLAGNDIEYDYKACIMGKNGSESSGTTVLNQSVIFAPSRDCWIIPIGNETESIHMIIEQSTGYGTSANKTKMQIIGLGEQKPIGIYDSVEDYESGSIVGIRKTNDGADAVFAKLRAFQSFNPLALKLPEGEVIFIDLYDVSRKRRDIAITELSFSWKEVQVERN